MELYFSSAHDFKECSTSSVVGVKGSFTQDEVAKKGGIESVSSTKDLLHVTCCFYLFLSGKKRGAGINDSQAFKTLQDQVIQVMFNPFSSHLYNVRIHPERKTKYNTHHPHNTFRLSPPLIDRLIPTCQGPLCDVGVQPLRLPHRVDGKQ